MRALRMMSKKAWFIFSQVAGIVKNSKRNCQRKYTKYDLSKWMHSLWLSFDLASVQ